MANEASSSIKVIDRSEFREEDGSISLENRIRGTFQYGFSWYGQMQAQEDVTKRLNKELGREHRLLRNVPVAGTSLIVPMLLLSPQGVRVIYPSTIRGVFRAKGEDWLRFDGRSRRFKRTLPNLQTQALAYAEAVHDYLLSLGYQLPEVEAALIFTNPRTHVDSARPRARVVLMDAIEHFARNLKQFQPIMDQEDINALTQAILNPRPPEPERPPEQKTAADRAESPFETKTLEPEDVFTAEVEPMSWPAQTMHRLSSLELSRNQWILLGVMAFFELIVLIVLTIVVIANTLYV
jgi:hypothetical protein